MTAVLALLLVNAVIGTFDTLYFHEYKAQLPHNLAHTRTELRLHAARDGVYCLIYGALAFFTPGGLFVAALALALLAEITITLADFVIEDRDRAALGGMPPGERVAHTLMAIVYGAMLSQLIPILIEGLANGTGWHRHDAPNVLALGCAVTAVGILVTGIRDLAATFDLLPERRFLERTPAMTETHENADVHA